MIINFDEYNEISMDNMFGGAGSVKRKIFMDRCGRVEKTVLSPGCEIGLHEHVISEEIMYVISGTAEVICNGQTETVSAGQCHYCPLKSKHSIKNTGTEDFIAVSVIPTMLND